MYCTPLSLLRLCQKGLFLQKTKTWLIDWLIPSLLSHFLSCPKNYSRLLVIDQEFLQVFHFISQNFWRPFFSHFLAFYISTIQNAASTTAQAISSDLSFIIHWTFSQHFAIFHFRTSKFTITTAQFPFYNCKLHFTAAEIVISCTLKYALLCSNLPRRRQTASKACSATYRRHV